MRNKKIGDATDKQINLIRNMEKTLYKLELPPYCSKKPPENEMLKHVASEIITLNMTRYKQKMSNWHKGLDQYSCKDA